MMRWIIESSLKIRLFVVAIGVLLIFFGVTQLSDLPVDILPEFSRPYVQVQTEALGLSAAEVEALITTPLEADMLNGVSWVEEIRSESIPGLSSIVLVFESGTDIMAARQMVQERLVSVFALPNVSKAPVMLNPMSSTSRTMMIGLTSKQLSKIEMSVLARWTIVPRLMGVPGVANVAIWGFRDRQIQVQIDPEELKEKKISLNQIISTTGNALWVSPLSFLNASTPGTGGFFDTPNQRFGIRHILPITTPNELSQVIIEGSKTTLGEVSNIIEEHQPLIGDAIVDESPNLILIVEKFPWANTLQVTNGVDEALKGLAPGLTGLEMNSSLFRPASFIEVAVDNLTETFLFGALLIIFALLAFFMNWRMIIISSVSILVSLIIVLGLIYLEGITLNMMIIAGITIGLGAILDDAVIDIDNIKNRIREEKEKKSNKSVISIIFNASIEMRTPIIYSTLILALIAVPFFFMKGIAGAFYQPIAITYTLVLAASFLVAITITPALTSLLFSRSPKELKVSPIIKFLNRIHEKNMSMLLKFTSVAFLIVCITSLIGLVLFFSFNEESLVPNFKESDLLVRWEAPPGTSHTEMNRILGLASKELDQIDGVNSVSGHVGRAVLSDLVKNVNTGHIWINIDPEKDYDRILFDIQSIVKGYPGFSHEVLTYSQSKVREELSGTDESFVVRVYGEDLNVIREKAEEIQKIMTSMDGIAESKILYPDIEPTLEIEVNLESIKRYGLKPGDVRRQVASLVSGLGVGNLFEEQKVFDVVVWGKPKTRKSITDIKNLLIETSGGNHIALKDVADIRVAPNEANIKRESVARYIDVIASINEGNIIDITGDVKNNIAKINFPLEYRAELLGEFALRMENYQRVRNFAIAALILIFLLFQAAFRSWKLAAAIFCTLPAALFGGIISNHIGFGNLLSMGSLIGFITVFGITVRNSIILIRHYRYLERNDGETFSFDLIKKGTRDRLGSIIITAVLLLLAFIPMLIYGNIAGLEIFHSISVVVIGSIFTSLIYTLFAVPLIYFLFGAEHEPDLELEPSASFIKES